MECILYFHNSLISSKSQYKFQKGYRCQQKKTHDAKYILEKIQYQKVKKTGCLLGVECYSTCTNCIRKSLSVVVIVAIVLIVAFITNCCRNKYASWFKPSYVHFFFVFLFFVFWFCFAFLLLLVGRFFHQNIKSKITKR